MKPARGFSLVELVCVIAIMAMVSAIALPHWAAAAQDYRLNLAASRIAHDITRAQTRANYTSTSVTISFSPSTNSYQIVGLPDPDRPSQTYTINLAADPYDLTLTSAAFGNATSLTFDGYGTPTAGGTILITAPRGGTRTITVDASSGKVSY